MLDVKKTLAKILANLKTPIKVQTFITASLTYPASGGQSATNAVPSVNGYTPLCVVGWNSYSWAVSVTRAVISGSNILWSARNFTNSQVTDNWIAFQILYIRSDLA